MDRKNRDVSVLDIVIILLGALVGSFISGVSGFGFGMIAMAAWVWFLDPRLAACMVVFASLITQSTAIACMRCRVKWRLIRPFLVGGLMGVPLGVALLGVLDVVVFKGVVGLIILFCSVVLLFVPPRSPMRPGGTLAGGAVGFLGGTMGGLCGLSGSPPIVWCLVNGWDKDTQRGLTQVFFLSTQALTMLGYILSGRITHHALVSFAIIAPCVFLGAYAGSRTAEHIDAVLFRRIVLALLLISGLVLVINSILGFVRS